MIKKIIPQTEFSKNVANVVGGTLISQLITISLSPVLSRIFSPADFGLYSIFINLAATTAVVSTFRYEFAVMLPKKDEEAINVVSLSFLITALYSLAVFLIFQLSGRALLALIHSEEIESYIPFVALYVFFFGAMNTLNYWLSRVKKFRQLSYGKVAQSTGTALFSIVFFYFGRNHGGLIIGAVLGQVSIGVLYLIFFRGDWLRLKAQVSWMKMKELFNRYIHFLSFNTPHSLLNVGQDLMVAALIKYYFGSEAAGFFFLSYRILKLPAGIISSATGQVFFQRVSELYPDADAMQHQITKVYKKLFLYSIPIFGTVLIGGPVLFSLVFGGDWREAGVYSQILSPTLMMAFILGPVSMIAVVVKMQHYNMLIGIADIIIRTVSLIIGGIYNSIYLGLGLMAAGTSLLLLFNMYWFYHLPKNKKVKSY